MTKTLWIIFLFGLSASLIWWPGAKNEETIQRLIQEERLWQRDHLGVDLVEIVDNQLKTIQHQAMSTTFLRNDSSNIPYTRSLGEEDFLSATHRVSSKPYFQALFSLLVLSLGRLIVTGLLLMLLLPFFLAVMIDGLVERKIRRIHMKFPNPYYFRLSGLALMIALEGLFLISLIPLWIPPVVIPLSFLALAYITHCLIIHYFD